MNEPRQKIMLSLGEGGCYVLSMVHVAEDLGGHRIDAVKAYLDLVRVGILREDGYVNDASAVMEALAGGQWGVRKEGPDYTPKSGEFEILRFERPTPKVIYSHFVLGDGQGRVRYDPLGGSQTMALGSVVSKRILKMG
jgi:hypothetical protein